MKRNLKEELTKICLGMTASMPDLANPKEVEKEVKQLLTLTSKTIDDVIGEDEKWDNISMAQLKEDQRARKKELLK